MNIDVRWIGRHTLDTKTQGCTESEGFEGNEMSSWKQLPLTHCVFPSPFSLPEAQGQAAVTCPADLSRPASAMIDEAVAPPTGGR